MKNKYHLIIALAIIFTSCKKLVEVGTPQNQLTTDKVFSDTSSATAAMVNTYVLFEKNIDPNYNKFLSVYTDELNYLGATPDNVQFYQSKLSATNGTIANMWSGFYSAIYSCNQIIGQLQQNSKIPPAMANSFSAESKFLRAYSNFYLVNTFGAVPLILTTDANQTAKAARTDSATIYAQIVNDLQDAQNGLPAAYIGTGKVRANKWAATALLARVYLYQHKWSQAEAQSTTIINSGLYTLTDPSQTFLADNTESILQFETQSGYITDAPSLIPNSGIPTFLISGSLLAAFEQGDLRMSDWLRSTTITSGGNSTTYFYPYKYHNRTSNANTPEYLVALRLAEQYLIRAEARAQQNNVTGAVQDINVIRQRAGLAGLSSTLSQNACLNSVNQEWRVEFFVEWGRRFLELKRTGRINQVMTAYKSTWLPQSALFPLPQKDLTYDPFLTQNAGY